MDNKQFLEIIATMNALWQPPLQTKAELTIWNGMIGDMEAVKVQGAIMALAQKSQYRPTVAQINETIDELTGTKRISATEAWLIARGCVSRYTTREQLEALPDDIRKAMREAGGSAYLGEQPEYRAQKAFESAWNAMGDTVKREQVQRIGSGMKLIGG